MTTKRSPSARSAPGRTRASLSHKAEPRPPAAARARPSVRRLDEDPSTIIRHFVQTLERMSGRPVRDDER